MDIRNLYLKFKFIMMFLMLVIRLICGCGYFTNLSPGPDFPVI
ncbi:hypothetical protein PI124_g12576 [Phytophthora idaei]|nr:hypothetical protein PI124_g12576 [Phytophthora idaei]